MIFLYISTFKNQDSSVVPPRLNDKPGRQTALPGGQCRSGGGRSDGHQNDILKRHSERNKESTLIV